MPMWPVNTKRGFTWSVREAQLASLFSLLHIQMANVETGSDSNMERKWLKSGLHILESKWHLLGWIPAYDLVASLWAYIWHAHITQWCHVWVHTWQVHMTWWCHLWVHTWHKHSYLHVFWQQCQTILKFQIKWMRWMWPVYAIITSILRMLRQEASCKFEDGPGLHSETLLKEN